MARVPDRSDHKATETSRSEENPERCKNTLRLVLKLPNHPRHDADKSTNLSVADEQTKACNPSELKPVHVTFGNAREEASINGSPNVEAREIYGMHPCTACDKYFHSLKALHGHMRIHNKAHPKKETKEGGNREEVTTTLNQICDPNIPGNEALKWRAKGKRTPQEDPPALIHDPDVLKGARDLMYLYNGRKESNTREINEAEKTET
ncbi:uncharacterized protein LOC109825465, partial [Asparagus officinalis]|uniref:uncharacterized protein LOC109825465 n=1 Tax=Asparagus officinalis TaxID=4686 RepID=UPI00098E270E